MSSVKTQRPFKRELKAGVPMTIDQRSEFIFIEQGQDLLVRADSSILDGRQKGDHIRPGAPFDSVTITSPYDQVIEFVMGWGEFSRLIVSGEMNVSAYVATQGRGQADSLPVDLVREVGIDSLGAVSYTTGTDVGQTPQRVSQCEQGAFYFDGKVWGLCKDNVMRSFDPESPAAWIDEIPYTRTGAPTYLRGATVGPDGTIYVKDNDNFWVMRWGEFNLFHPAVARSIAGGTNGLHYYDGGVYALEQTNGSQAGQIVRFDAETWDVDVVCTGLGSGELGQLTGRGNVLYVANGGGTKAYSIAGDGTVARDLSEDIGLQVAGSFCTVTPDLLLRITTQGATGSDYYLVEHAQTVTIEGKLYCQPVGDSARRITRVLTEKPRYIPAGAGAALVYDWVGFALESLAGEPGRPYLDYLTGYAHDDGRGLIRVGSGTQTFGKRGMTVGDIRALDGSELTVSVLPDYFV